MGGIWFAIIALWAVLAGIFLYGMILNMKLKKSERQTSRRLEIKEKLEANPASYAAPDAVLSEQELEIICDRMTDDYINQKCREDWLARGKNLNLVKPEENSEAARSIMGTSLKYAYLGLTFKPVAAKVRSYSRKVTFGEAGGLTERAIDEIVCAAEERLMRDIPAEEMSPDEFLSRRAECKKDGRGVLIAQNLRNHLCYVGKAKKIYALADALLSGNENPAFYADYQSGDPFRLIFIRLRGSGYKEPEQLEHDMIVKYNVFQDGYNDVMARCMEIMWELKWGGTP